MPTTPQQPTVTIMNHEEARKATGETDPIRAIMALVEMGCLNPAVTSPDGVVARIDGEWASAAAHAVTARRTDGAGDCFSDVFSGVYAAGRTLDESLRLGQAAVARYVTEQPSLDDLDELAAWAEAQPKVAVTRRPERPAVNLRRVASVAVAAAATILLVALVR